MSFFEVTVGWTLFDQPDSRYRPMLDGYRPGAVQHCETFKVEWTNAPVPVDEATRAWLGISEEEAEKAAAVRIAETLGEAVFYATNAPRLRVPEGLTGQVCRAVEATGYTGEQAGHYSLSTGDTVSVEGVTVAVETTGWRLV